MTLRLTRSVALAVTVAVAVAAASAALMAQAPPEQDAARAAWRYRRPVVLPSGAGDGRFVAVAIPPDVAEHSQPGLADLRIVADDGREVAYVLDVDVPRTAERRRSGRLVETQSERKRMSAWVVDFETAVPFDRLELDIDGTDFSKRLELETSLDGTQWTRVGEAAWVFDQEWRGRRIHDTALEQAAPLTARYVRITVDDFRSTRMTVRNVTAVLTSHLGGRRWTREAPLVRLETAPGQPSRYRVDIPAGVPVERIAVATDDVAFWRDLRVFESGPRGAVEPVSGRETIYRVRLDDADLDAERLDVDLARPVAAPLIIEVEDGDSPPLARPRVTLSGMERRALVPATVGGLTLYYGNAATRRPVYDLEALRARLSLVESYPQATLGPEAGNPRFAPLAPMAFLAARGAAAETSRWAVARQLRITGGDDVYTLTLSAADLIYLRPDLGDIRLVDGARRQVPYVLEPRAAAARVALDGAAGDTPRQRAQDVRLAADRTVDRPRRRQPVGAAAGRPRAVRRRRLLHAAGGAAGAGSPIAARPARAPPGHAALVAARQRGHAGRAGLRAGRAAHGHARPRGGQRRQRAADAAACGRRGLGAAPHLQGRRRRLSAVVRQSRGRRADLRSGRPAAGRAGLLGDPDRVVGAAGAGAQRRLRARRARRALEPRARAAAVDRPRLLDRRAALADQGDPQVAAVAAHSADALRRPMDPRAWSEIEAVLEAALEVEPGGRAALLRDRCEGRPDVLAEVESLLAAHDRATHFLEPAVVAEPDDRVSAVGAFIDAYHLVERIGEGGMGEVYRAERADGTFAHQVAVKIGRVAMAGADATRRFRAEQAILASLHHPNVVTLFDAGTLADGRPFFVMELVDGAPITRHCRDAGLGLDARLRLFRQVCAAVQHAHRHAVVHRDLKPANILVTADGLPKVLDFGIAKLLDSPAAAANPTLTGPWSGPLTPNYASPEQVRGLPVTTASDIYALGVLLYELVVGVRPYDVEGKPLDEVMRLIAQADPPRPSAAAAGRDAPGIEPRRLRGDLDAIVLKAMHKDPEGRFASADELAADLGRFLDGRAVEAREPSFSYLAWALARRHKTGVAIAALALAGVIGALGVALWQRQVAVRERLRAEQNFADTRRLANTLIFEIHDAILPLAGATPVRRTIADEAARYLARLDAQDGDDPTLRRELAVAYGRLGAVLGNPSGPNLGDREGALKALNRARELLRPLAASTSAPADVLAALIAIDNQLATVIATAPSGPVAIEPRALRREAVDAGERLVARAPADDRYRTALGSALFGLALGEPGKAALPVWERARQVYASLLDARPADPGRMRNVALVHKYIGVVHDNERESDLAERHYREALQLDERRLTGRPDDRQAMFDVAIDLGNVAGMAMRRDDFRNALPLLERSVALRDTLAASDPADVQARQRLARALSRLGTCYRLLGDAARARAQHERALALFAAGDGAPRDLYVRWELGTLRYDVGLLALQERRPLDACRWFRLALDDYQAVGAGRPLTTMERSQVEELSGNMRPCAAPATGR